MNENNTYKIIKVTYTKNIIVVQIFFCERMYMTSVFAPMCQEVVTQKIVYKRGAM